MRHTVRPVDDPTQRQVNDTLLAAVNELARFFSSGDGAPSHTPDGPQIYFRQDGPGVYVYNGIWVAL